MAPLNVCKQKVNIENRSFLLKQASGHCQKSWNTSYLVKKLTNTVISQPELDGNYRYRYTVVSSSTLMFRISGRTGTVVWGGASLVWPACPGWPLIAASRPGMLYSRPSSRGSPPTQTWDSSPRLWWLGTSDALATEVFWRQRCFDVDSATVWQPTENKTSSGVPLPVNMHHPCQSAHSNTVGQLSLVKSNVS